MKTILVTILFTLIFIAVCIGSVFGVYAPSNSPVSPVGAMQLAASPNGLTLSQGFRGQFYDFSPLNDSFTLPDAQVLRLISLDEAEKHSYKIAYPGSKIERMRDTILAYFSLKTPENSFQTDKKIVYTSTIDKNNLTVTRKVLLPENLKPIKTALTLSFTGGDIVYDDQGNLYTFVLDDDLLTFQKTYGISLTPKLEDIFATISGKTLFVYNPKLAGVIAVNAKQGQILKVDRNAKLIVLEEQVQPGKKNYQTSMHIAIFDTPQEARR